MRPKDPLPRQETSGVVYRIWCSCGQSTYVGETGRLLRTRIAEHVAAVRRNDANAQVAAHSTRPGHTFKFDEAEILARGDNRVSRELLESWFTGPQSTNKCNDIPTPYSVLRHRLAIALDHSGRAQVGEPDGRAIITPASNTGDEITAINNLHAGHQAISAPAGSNFLCTSYPFLPMSLMMGSSEDPKRQANKALAPAIASSSSSSSSSSDQLVPGTRMFACIGNECRLKQHLPNSLLLLLLLLLLPI
ncbi:hypothetical protein SprV_0301319400 [Sparganum proliferum]